VGDTVSLTMQASGAASGATWSYAATGLPSGLSIDAGTGAITGTVTGAAAKDTVKVTAADGNGASVSQSFTWQVSVLSLTNPGAQYNAVGDKVSLALKTSGLPTGDKWTYSAAGLPSGLSINTSTGAITGKVSGTATSYSATVTAGDGKGASVSQTFTWNISVLALTNPGTQSAAVGASVSLQMNATGVPPGETSTYTASGLPTGLSINAGTGLISGTISGASKKYSVTVKITDKDGATTSQTFAFDVT
jgi:hypothetical protein